MKFSISASEVVYYHNIIEANDFQDALTQLNDIMSTIGLTEIDVRNFKINTIEEVK